MNHTKERIEELFQGLLRAAQRSDNMSAGAHAIIGRGAALPGEDLELLLALSDRTEQQTQKALDDWNDEKIPEAEFVHRARLLASVDAYLVARLKHYGAEAPERLIIDWEQLDPVQKQQAEISAKDFPLNTEAKLAGRDFGRLHAIGAIGRTFGNTIYLCRCTCGNWKLVRDYELKRDTRSCGCLRRDLLTKHGGTGSKLYGVWNSMRGRCERPTDQSFKNYGARGIRVCPEWSADFDAFRSWALNNGYQPGLTLDRIDNDGDYTPENCRWATRKQQANNSRANVLVEYHGELLTLQQASETSGISYTCLKKRRDRKPGITEEELFRAPKRRTPSAASGNKKSERPADRPQK